MTLESILFGNQGLSCSTQGPSVPGGVLSSHIIHQHGWLKLRSPTSSLSSQLEMSHLMGIWVTEEELCHQGGFEFLVKRHQGGQGQACFLLWEKEDGAVGRPGQAGLLLEELGGHRLKLFLQP